MKARAPALVAGLAALAAACWRSDPAPAAARVRLVETPATLGAAPPRGGARPLMGAFEEGLAPWRRVVDSQAPLADIPGTFEATLATEAERAVLALEGSRGGLYRILPIEPGQTYAFRGRLRARGLVPETPEAFFGATYFLAELRSRGTPEEVFDGPVDDAVLVRHLLESVTGDTGWEERERVFRAGPESRGLLVVCILGLTEDVAAGAVDFADVRVDAVDREEYWRQRLAQAVALNGSAAVEPDAWQARRLVRGAIAGESRPAALLLPGETLRFELAAPRGELRFETGVGPWGEALETARSRELSFTIRVSGRPAAERRLALPERAVDARWQDWRIELGEADASTVTVELSVEGGVPGLFGAPTLRAAGDRSPGPNVLLISIDTLRADRVGAYGHTPSPTPHLDALAREGLLFRDATAQAPYTLPSHVSLFSGQFPSVHGVHRGGSVVSPRRTPMLAASLARTGMATRAFTAGGYMNPMFGFDRGFDAYSNVDPIRHPPRATSTS